MDVLQKGKKASKKNVSKFTIDCSAPVGDSVMSSEALKSFFASHIKVNGKAGKIDGKVNFDGTSEKKVVVSAEQPFSKRYLKYLTKKYLKKNQLRDFLRVIATSTNDYELRYFNVGGEDEEVEQD